MESNACPSTRLCDACSGGGFGGIYKHMKAQSFLIAVALALVTSLHAHSQNLDDADRVIAFSRESVGRIKSWSAKLQFQQRIHGDDDLYKGAVFYKAPHLFREELEMAEPFAGRGSSLTVVGADGLLWWDWREGQMRQLMKSNLRQPQAPANSFAGLVVDITGKAPPGVGFGIDTGIFKYRTVSTAEIDGETVYVLEGLANQGAMAAQTPNTLADALKLSRIYIGRRNGFVYKMEVFYDFKGSTKCLCRAEFSDVKINIPIPDGSFVFKQPAGVPVIDLNEMKKRYMK